MKEWIWLNGEVLPMAEARIDPEDRGFQFADGVYEVIRIYRGRPFTLDAHVDRLERSCGGIEMAPPARRRVTSAVESILERTGIVDGMIYLQVTRGVSPRNHLICGDLREAGVFRGTILCYARSLPELPPVGQARGVSLMSVPDERWKRCWVKSIALLPNILAKNRAVDGGADEAVLIDEGQIVTECSASNIFGVLGGVLVTHPIGPKVLPGVTRLVLLGLARERGIEVQERPWTVAEAAAAQEIFITSTTREVDWVSRWDGRILATGCGPITLALATALRSKTDQ